MQDAQVVGVRREGYTALQVGCKDAKEKRTNHAMLGHFRKAGTAPKMRVAEWQVDDDAVVGLGWLTFA